MSTTNPQITFYWVNDTPDEITYSVDPPPQSFTIEPTEESQAVCSLVPENAYQNLPWVQIVGGSEVVFSAMLTETGGTYSVTVQGGNGIDPVSKSGKSTKYEVKLHLQLNTGGGLIVGAIDILGEGDLIA
jgi:hypothetical protein